MEQKLRTFPKVIRRYILWCLGFILLFYTTILIFYLIHGAYIATSFGIELYGRQYERDLTADPQAPPPDSFNITTYETFEDIPEQIRREIPKNKIKLGKLFDVQLKSFEKQIKSGEKRLDLLYMILPYQLNDGRILFIVQNFNQDDKNSVFFKEIINFSLVTLPIAGGVIILFLIIIGRLGKQLADPAQELALWAQNLKSENLNHPIPNFGFIELNSVANELHGSLVRLDEFVIREREFLQHASHELRTPVTVVSGNIELLAKHDLTTQQIKIVDRINRASRNMKQLIETLLWLGREREPDLIKEEVDYPALLSDVLDDLSYLSQSENIEHQVKMKNTNSVSASPAALYIVVSNLIRNAFQHTPKGHVNVQLENNVLTIENFLDTQSPQLSNEQTEGVGLNLVQRICTRCSWLCETTPLENGGMRAVLSLTKKI
ncbi:histidine kinase dimerization/phospho-acceptor domain-containing protein [Kiloniella litopenaei]|uniref:ATP-binding protein n=1 Tax=Kiloniella litopenaei TaxID=1549748 RepID=UPI003BAD0403